MAEKTPHSVIYLVRAEKIEANPFQVRGLDEELLVELEAAIHEQGLRGVLVGRLVEQDGTPVVDETEEVRAMQALATGTYRMQIAWGHHRLEAAKRAGILDVRVEIVPGLDDEKMAAWALMENVRRKELSAIEEAQAIRQLVDGFGWTQERVAESLGYASAATVSNKLRLLRLPEEIQEKVKSGDLAERSARMLVRVAEISPKKAVELVAGKGKDVPVYEHEVERELRLATKPLAGNDWERAPWPAGWLPAVLGEDAVTCETCEQHIQMGGATRCTKVSCWNKRRREWEAQIVARAGEKCGIPALGEGQKAKSLRTDWRVSGFLRTRCYPEGGRLCAHLRMRYSDVRINGDGEHVEEVCGDEGAFGKCLEQWGAEQEKAKEAQGDLVQQCRAVIERAAKVLGRRLLVLPRPFAQVIVEHFGGITGWQEVPEEWEDPYAVLAWKVVCRGFKLSGWSAPAGVEEVTGEVQALMVRLGVAEW